jgi:topoisomerase-4 subunit B
MAKTVSKASKNPKKTGTVGDLFAGIDKPRSAGKAARAHAPSSAEAGYTAKHIEVLEGLEPVRRRPGMYIGGTDEKALHHLFAEVIDN